MCKHHSSVNVDESPGASVRDQANHDLIEGADLERSGLEVALRRRTLPMLARREGRQ